MLDQHLFKSPAKEVYGHCRLLLPWLRVPSLFFWQLRVEKLLAWAAGDWTHNLKSLFSVRCLWPLSHGNPWGVYKLNVYSVLKFEQSIGPRTDSQSKIWTNSQSLHPYELSASIVIHSVTLYRFFSWITCTRINNYITIWKMT